VKCPRADEELGRGQRGSKRGLKPKKNRVFSQTGQVRRKKGRARRDEGCGLLFRTRAPNNVKTSRGPCGLCTRTDPGRTGGKVQAQQANQRRCDVNPMRGTKQCMQA